MNSGSLREFFVMCVEGTTEKAVVPTIALRLCNLTNTVAQVLGLTTNSTYSVVLSARALKHLYDKKPAEEFACILDGLHEVVRYPVRIYANKQGKRGSFCLVGEYNDSIYLCALEIAEAKVNYALHIATAFRIRDEKYLAKYTLLWSREDGNPHRNALDAHEESTNVPQ